jgi:hypothetical protein
MNSERFALIMITIIISLAMIFSFLEKVMK